MDMSMFVMAMSIYMIVVIVVIVVVQHYSLMVHPIEKEQLYYFF